MNKFLEIEKHIAFLEINPELTKSLVRTYCISQKIKYVAKHDKEKIKALLNEGFIVCWCDKVGRCGIKPYFYTKDENDTYFIHYYLNYTQKFLHQKERLYGKTEET